MSQAQVLFESYMSGNMPGSEVPQQVQGLLRDAKEAGYTPWKAGFSTLSNPFFIQRRIRDNLGSTLYFINIEIWDLRREFPAAYTPASFTAKAQFYIRCSHDAVDVSMHQGDHTRASIEQFFANLYDRMPFEPYEAT